MSTARRSLMAAWLLIGGLATTASAQGVHIVPTVGAFIPASDFRGVREGADQVRLEREATLGLSLNVEVGLFRASLAYASGATISERGAEGRTGDGSVLAVAADLLLRPISGGPLQPYLLGGAGLKRQDFSFEDDGLSSNPLPDGSRDLTLHFGGGLDLMLGGIGLRFEVSDFLSRDDEGSFRQHDAFVMVGLRFRLGGGG
jgi:hypothetical protein